MVNYRYNNRVFKERLNLVLGIGLIHEAFPIFDIFTVVCLALSAYWGFTHGPEAGVSTMLKALTITAILAVMEVSLSLTMLS